MQKTLGRPKKYNCDVKKVLISAPINAMPNIRKFIKSESKKYLITKKS